MAEGHSNKSDHDHKKAMKKKKLVKYIAIFAVFQVIVIAVFGLVVMRVRSPKLRIGEISLQTLETGTQASPTFDAAFGAEVRIKNPNFGRFKYDTTTVSFVYQGIIVGQALVPAGRVGMKKTKEVPIFATASSRNLGGLAGNAVAAELRAGFLSLSGKTVMRGKVEIMGVVKKRKNVELNCFIVFNLALKIVQRLDCQ